MSIQLELPFPPEIEWRDIPGYEGWYQVSNTGFVKRVKAGAGAQAGRILVPAITRSYLRLCLHMEGVSRNFTIHRLVANAFIGACPDGMQVNHKNGDKLDNHVENLEYVTASQNTLHAWRVLKTCAPQNGSKNRHAKLNEDDVREIRKRIKAGEKRSHLAVEYGLSYANIGMIVRRERWSHIE